jgi:hypothetical protein
MTTVAFSMGKAPRNDTTVSKTVQQNPGPGNYNANYKKVARKAPDFVVGTGLRPELTDGWKMKTPAPGTYETRSQILEPKVKQKIGIKLIPGGAIDVGKKYVPGPGTYTPQKTIYDPQKKFSIGMKTVTPTQMIIQPNGSHKKAMTSRDLVPGPGQY